MLSLTNTVLKSSLRLANSSKSHIDEIIGAAIFDLNGLPREYFTTSEDMSWVQIIFQSLGLRSLLMSSLQLEGFHHVMIQGNGYCAVVVKQRSHYAALLLQQQGEEISDCLVEWAQSFQLSALREHPRFHAA